MKYKPNNTNIPQGKKRYSLHKYILEKDYTEYWIHNCTLHLSCSIQIVNRWCSATNTKRYPNIIIVIPCETKWTLHINNVAIQVT
jgi:hypothetical protein